MRQRILFHALSLTLVLLLHPGGMSYAQPPGPGPGGGPPFPPGDVLGFLPPVPPVPPLLAALDVDGDGQLSAEELARAVAALKQLDANQDGELTLDELMGGPPPFAGPFPGFPPPGGPGGFGPPLPPVLAALDSDGDGEISAEELSAAVSALQGLDRNDDGELTGDELMGAMPGFGGPGFGPGGPMGRRTIDVLDQFDVDQNGLLDREERAAARSHLEENRGAGGGPFGGPGPGGGGPGRGGPFGPREGVEVQPGKRLAPGDVPAYPHEDLYAAGVIRTLFFEFENDDWEEELEAFRDTDVEVPARLVVDGDVLEDVGVRFRGNTSYMMVPRGLKRSLNVSINYGHPKQLLRGYRTLNLLNANSDPSFLRNILFNRISREFIPALDANLVRVVINGESWGLYVNEEQFNSDFLRKWYGTSDGARWKVPPNFSGSSGLMYLGDQLEPYKQNYELKTSDDDAAWQRLMEACRVIDEFRERQDLAELEKVLDVNQTLWFLAVDNALGDDDGYFSRASDYNIFLDGRDQRIHLVSHDNNETFRLAGGPGFPGGGGFGGQLDPLARIDDPSRPLVRSLLSHPQLRARYLAYVRTIAEHWLDWEVLGPIYDRYVALMDQDMWDDTRRSSSYAEFLESAAPAGGGSTGPRGAPGLRAFVEQRRAYLLDHPDIARSEVVVPVGTAVMINELMPGNSRTVPDPAGTYVDWIELYNGSPEEVDLSGAYLSDSAAKPRKWSFPPGTVIPAGGYLVVWADGSGTTDQGLRTNFKLSKQGETLWLVDSDAAGNAVLDQVRYERLGQEVSWGRYPCGGADWQPSVPTPGSANRVRE